MPDTLPREANASSSAAAISGDVHCPPRRGGHPMFTDGPLDFTGVCGDRVPSGDADMLANAPSSCSPAL